MPYRFEVVDWKIHSQIQIYQTEQKDLTESPVAEMTNLILMCKLISPEIKNISRVEVNLFSEPKMEHHPYKPDDDVFFKVVGGMLVDEANVLGLGCGIPPRMAFQVQVAVASAKVNHILVNGSRLVNRDAWIYEIAMSTTLIPNTS